jgi:hypothetical protein
VEILIGKKSKQRFQVTLIVVQETQLILGGQPEQGRYGNSNIYAVL